MNFFSSPIWLVLMASVLYGVNAPCMKMASTNGATPSGMALVYGIGSLIIAFSSRGSGPLFPNMPSLLWSIPMGIICGLAFLLIGKAFGLGASVALVTIIVTAHPLFSCVISMTCMNEWKGIIPWKFLTGCLLVILGVYFVSTSTKG